MATGESPDVSSQTRGAFDGGKDGVRCCGLEEEDDESFGGAGAVIGGGGGIGFRSLEFAALSFCEREREGGPGGGVRDGRRRTLAMPFKGGGGG